MAQIHFNRIYIIESLLNGDTLTGTNLHNDLLRYKSINHPDFKSILKTPKNKKEWDDVFVEIKNDCEENGNASIIHFEIHGSKDGLRLTSEDSIKWDELYQYLAPINSILHNELFVTFAVCYGAFFLKSSYINRQTAFRGFVGSFEPILVNDLVIRYESFYQELFSSFDLNKSYEQLVKSNPSLPNCYACFSAEYVFAYCYLEYLKMECTNQALVERAKQVMQDNNMNYNRTERRKFIKSFVKTEQNNSNRYFKQDYKTFFMLDLYPELESSIEFKDSIVDMKNWFKSLA